MKTLTYISWPYCEYTAKRRMVAGFLTDDGVYRDKFPLMEGNVVKGYNVSVTLPEGIELPNPNKWGVIIITEKQALEYGLIEDDQEYLTSLNFEFS